MNGAYDGGCLCGDLRYGARGAPARVNACHCTACQRMTGSAYYAGAIFAKDAVTFSGVEPRIYEHRSDESGYRVWMHSCPRCATTVALTFERFPDACALLRGTLDDPDRVAVERHFFTRSAQRGTLLPAGVECYAAFRVDLDGTPQAPAVYDTPMQSAGRGRPLEPAPGAAASEA